MINKNSINFCTVEIEIKSDEIVCSPVWPNINVDRRRSFGIVLRPSKIALALRYKNAVENGKIYSNPCIALDALGKTYIKHDGFVWGKYLNADLKKVGF